MTPNEIYASETIGRETSLYALLEARGNHVPEVLWHLVDDEKNTRVTLRTHYDPYIDGNRICRILSVWLDDKPVMIVRNGGRSGKDAHDRFITDAERYVAMVHYLQSISNVEAADDPDRVHPNEHLEKLTFFYGIEFAIADKKLVSTDV